MKNFMVIAALVASASAVTLKGALDQKNGWFDE